MERLIVSSLKKLVIFLICFFLTAPVFAKDVAMKYPTGTSIVVTTPSDITSFIPDAPSDGSTYGRNNGGWQIINFPGTETDPIWNAAKGSYSTTAQANALYLGISSQASDSAKLNGQSASFYYPASNPNSYTTLAAVAGVGYLTSVTAHNLLSTTHGDTTASACARGSIIVGDSNSKWVNLAFPATPTGKVLIATATDVVWSTNALGSAAYTASTAYDVSGAAAAVTPTTLGLVIGTNVQAYNANLTAINQALTTTSSPSFTAVGATTFTGALTGTASGNLTSANIEDNITDGHTTIAPSGNAVFDALALKSPLANPTFTGVVTAPQVINTNNAITATGNAATVPVTSTINTVTNNSAATLTITITTASAVVGQLSEVRILDATGVAQTITWVNTENSTVTAPTTSNGSTTLPLSVLFQFNNASGKWRCIASA